MATAARTLSAHAGHVAGNGGGQRHAKALDVDDVLRGRIAAVNQIGNILGIAEIEDIRAGAMFQHEAARAALDAAVYRDGAAQNRGDLSCRGKRGRRLDDR